MSKILTALLILLSFYVRGQDNAMSSDRPGSTYSTSPLLKGEFQLQSGLNYQFHIQEPNPLILITNKHLFQGNINLRFGLSDKFELEAAFPQQLEFISSAYQLEDTPIDKQTTFDYLNGVGLFSRFAIFRENPKGWSLGTRFGFQYDSFVRSGITANLDLTLQKNFKEGLSLSSSLSYFHLVANELPNAQWLQWAINANYSLSEKIKLYGDFQSSMAIGANDLEEILAWQMFIASIGTQYFLSENLALDTGFGLGKGNSSGPNLETEVDSQKSQSDLIYCTVGVSYRF